MRDISRADIVSAAKEQIRLKKPQTDELKETEWRRGSNQPNNPGNQNRNHFRLRNYGTGDYPPYRDIAVVFKANEPAVGIELIAEVRRRGPGAMLGEEQVTLVDTTHSTKDADELVSNYKGDIEAKLQRIVDDQAELAAKGLAEEMR